MKLYLIRHAKAAERGVVYPDDSLRPLIDKGHQQAKQLAAYLKALDIRFDLLASSPYIRAQQTAKPLKDLLKGKAYFELRELADHDYDALLAALNNHCQDTELDPKAALALVGHEPYLSELASYLLVGDDRLNIKFSKGSMMELEGRLVPRAMILKAMIPPKYGMVDV
ncbi:MAG: phosphohistidine phosphatase SixA [Deinococcales bacterium]